MNKKIFDPERYGMTTCPTCDSQGFVLHPRRQCCPKCGGFGLVQKGAVRRYECLANKWGEERKHTIKEEEVRVKKENKTPNSKGKAKTGKKTYKNVEISFYSPESMNVYVAGEFNSWDTRSLPMNRERNRVWRSKIKLLPGRYEYKFFADNTWVEDLPNSETVFNPFGTKNFVISVQ
jgi:hypothetical protein